MPRAAASLMLHPLVILATLLLWYNDNIAKFQHPSWLTGKLSDFCGMVVFPVLLVSIAEILAAAIGRHYRAGILAIVAAALSTGVVFTAIKLNDFSAQLYRNFFEWRWSLQAMLLNGDAPVVNVCHAMDPTDLIALPLLLVPIWIGRQTPYACFYRNNLRFVDHDHDP